MNALHCWMPINTEFGHSARFLLSFKTVCAVENGPPRLPTPSFVWVELRRTPSQPYLLHSLFQLSKEQSTMKYDKSSTNPPFAYDKLFIWNKNEPGEVLAAKNPLRFESKAESAWRIADLRLGICIACVAGPQFYGGPDLQRACHAGQYMHGTVHSFPNFDKSLWHKI